MVLLYSLENFFIYKKKQILCALTLLGIWKPWSRCSKCWCRWYIVQGRKRTTQVTISIVAVVATGCNCLHMKNHFFQEVSSGASDYANILWKTTSAFSRVVALKLQFHIFTS